ncbi:MAG: MoaD/ThiS family protein [Pseudomonadota bacterium]|nr:MoaD/ThiS family protein [Pseudomonadota bacterium]
MHIGERGGHGREGDADPGAGALVVLIPGLLRSYTSGAATIRLPACLERRTLDSALRELDQRFPGIRFRIVDEQQHVRPHMKCFVDASLAGDLHADITGARELMIVGALSGG